jgi:hypothetical protein
MEDDLLGMALNLRPNLDQFLPQRRQRPITHRLRQPDRCLMRFRASTFGDRFRAFWEPLPSEKKGP